MLSPFEPWQEHGGGVLPLSPLDHHQPWRDPLSSLGQEYLRTDDGQLETAAAGAQALTGHGAGSTTSATATGTAATTASPASTMVGSSTGLRIDLVWDASVKDSANWKSVESAVVQAAKIYTSDFSNKDVLTIHVGYGEVDGTALRSGDLGESNADGYFASYSQIEGALTSHDADLVKAGDMSSNATAALQALKSESFFVTSAEAKALGLAPGTTGTDGYIGLSKSSSMVFSDSGTIKAGQYDAVGVAAHELSEVMGRIGNEGASLGGTGDVYTPLDIFRYTSSHHPDTKASGGYFSLTDGATSLDTYNNPSNGGDAADWASTTANNANAYDAFGKAGVKTDVTAADLQEVAALGFTIDSGHILKTTVA